MREEANMFSKIIGRSVFAHGICRSHITNACKLPRNYKSHAILVAAERRNIHRHSCLLQIAENVEKKSTGKNPEAEGNEVEEKSNAAETKPRTSESDKSDVAKTEAEEDEDERERREDRKWRRFGREVMLSSFAASEKKNRDTYLECLRIYEKSPGRKVERVLFIYSALRHMEEFGVHRDLEVYKAILNIFPKEAMVPTNVFQTWFMHYPREQYCAVAVLEQMENNLVIPDPETEILLLNIFGSHGLPLQKYWKMMYWMPKFRHKNPWPVPNPLPDDPLELAKLALTKISSVDVNSRLSVFDAAEVEDSLDKTWIVSAMAPRQNELLARHNRRNAVYVEGPHKIYVATRSLDYFTLRADPPEVRLIPPYEPDAVNKIRNPYLETTSAGLIEIPSVHEEVDGTIMANCATGTSSKDSLLSWIRCLQRENPSLGEIPVVFTLRNVAREHYFIAEEEDAKKAAGSKEDRRAAP